MYQMKSEIYRKAIADCRMMMVAQLSGLVSLCAQGCSAKDIETLTYTRTPYTHLIHTRTQTSRQKERDRNCAKSGAAVPRLGQGWSVGGRWTDENAGGGE